MGQGLCPCPGKSIARTRWPKAASSGLRSRQHHAPWHEPCTKTISDMADLPKKFRQHRCINLWAVDTRQMSRLSDQLELRAMDQLHGLAHQIRWRRPILRSRNAKRRQAQPAGGRIEIR